MKGDKSRKKNNAPSVAGADDSEDRSYEYVYNSEEEYESESESLSSSSASSSSSIKTDSSYDSGTDSSDDSYDEESEQPDFDKYQKVTLSDEDEKAIRQIGGLSAESADEIYGDTIEIIANIIGLRRYTADPNNLVQLQDNEFLLRCMEEAEATQNQKFINHLRWHPLRGKVPSVRPVRPEPQQQNNKEENMKELLEQMELPYDEAELTKLAGDKKYQNLGEDDQRKLAKALCSNIVRQDEETATFLMKKMGVPLDAKFKTKDGQDVYAFEIGVYAFKIGKFHGGLSLSLAPFLKDENGNIPEDLVKTIAEYYKANKDATGDQKSSLGVVLQALDLAAQEQYGYNIDEFRLKFNEMAGGKAYKNIIEIENAAFLREFQKVVMSDNVDDVKQFFESNANNMDLIGFKPPFDLINYKYGAYRVVEELIRLGNPGVVRYLFGNTKIGTALTEEEFQICFKKTAKFEASALRLKVLLGYFGNRITDKTLEEVIKDGDSDSSSKILCQSHLNKRSSPDAAADNVGGDGKKMPTAAASPSRGGAAHPVDDAAAKGIRKGKVTAADKGIKRGAKSEPERGGLVLNERRIGDAPVKQEAMKLDAALDKAIKDVGADKKLKDNVSEFFKDKDKKVELGTAEECAIALRVAYLVKARNELCGKVIAATSKLGREAEEATLREFITDNKYTTYSSENTMQIYARNKSQEFNEEHKAAAAAATANKAGKGGQPAPKGGKKGGKPAPAPGGGGNNPPAPIIDAMDQGEHGQQGEDIKNDPKAGTAHASDNTNPIIKFAAKVWKAICDVFKSIGQAIGLVK